MKKEHEKELEKIKNNEDVICMVLFGSALKKEEYNDIDLLVITKRKINLVLPEIFHIFCYTLKEIKEEISSGNPFFIALFSEGKVLKGKNLWEKLKRLFFILHKDKGLEYRYKGKVYKIEDIFP